MSAQTSYAINQPVAYAGLIYDANSGRDVVSRDAEGVVPFGVAVGRGTDADRQCAAGGAATAYLGVSVRSLEREGAANTGAVQYEDTETVGIMRTGYVWAVCPTGCVPGDAVIYTVATGVLDTGVAGVGAAEIDGAAWQTTTAAGDLGVIRLGSGSATAGI
jgi:hypothetical protein